MKFENLKKEEIIVLPVDRRPGDISRIKIRKAFENENFLSAKEFYLKIGGKENGSREYAFAKDWERKGLLEAIIIRGKMYYRLKEKEEE